MTGVSVIICCYNSEHRLAETLKHLAAQKLPVGFSWEIVVVNNNSSDNTSKAAYVEWAKHSLPAPFRVVDEPDPGLSNARRRGIREARFDYLIFCDDDNWLNDDYVITAYKLLSSDESIAAAGGISTAVFEIAKPEWFDRFQGYFAVGPQSQLQYKILRGYNYLYGAGIVLRKCVFEKLNSRQFHFFLADRKRESLLAGGDVELCLALRLLNYKLVYTTDLRFFHYMPAQRLNLDYLRSLVFSCPPTWIVFNAYHYFLAGRQVSPEIFYRQIISHTLKYVKSNGRSYIKSLLKREKTRRITYEARLIYLFHLVFKKNKYNRCVDHLSVVFG